MAKINSRTKGATAERELAAILFDHLGVRLVRNLEQCRGGGHDLIVAPDQTGPVTDYINSFAIECKRYAAITPAKINTWWEQATKQGAIAGKLPLLAYRGDRGQWRVVLHLYDGHTVEISLFTFMFMARECVFLKTVDA